MYKGRSRILPVILVIIVTIVAIIALVSLGKAILNRGGTAPIAQNNQTENSLLQSDVDSGVRMVVRGPIVADENFHSYKITVSPSERIITTYKGYEEQVIASKRFGNSTPAYEEFVHALNKLNFADVAQNVDELSDVRGVCASGRLYEFAIMRAQSSVSSSWVASCRGTNGSFKGNAVAVRDLFQKQIPDYTSYLRDLNL